METTQTKMIPLWKNGIEPLQLLISVNNPFVKSETNQTKLFHI